MRHERVLLILILSELVLIVLGAVVAFALEPAAFEMPGQVAMQAASSPRVSAPFLTALWVVVAIGTVLSWVGLLYLFREARELYLGSWVAYLALSFLRGPMVAAPLGAVIEMLMALVGGGILGTVYLSELRTKFRPFAEAVRGHAAPLRGGDDS